MKIIVEFVNPPIPIRTCDYCAYIDGEEENTRVQGWGNTEVEALAELVERLSEREDER